MSQTQKPKNDEELFRDLVEAILSADQWDVWRQDANAAVEWALPAYRLKGLLGVVDGQREWWPYEVDRKRLRSEGAQAIARDFMQRYAQAREYKSQSK